MPKTHPAAVFIATMGPYIRQFSEAVDRLGSLAKRFEELKPESTTIDDIDKWTEEWSAATGVFVETATQVVSASTPYGSNLQGS